MKTFLYLLVLFHSWRTACYHAFITREATRRNLITSAVWQESPARPLVEGRIAYARVMRDYHIERLHALRDTSEAEQFTLGFKEAVARQSRP